MADRHRGFGQGFDRGPGRDRNDRPGGFRGEGGYRGPSGPGGPGPRRDQGRPGPRGDRPDGPPPPRPQYREARPPAPPAEASEFQEVDADLAIALLETATRLTEIVGTAGLPDEPTSRRQAVLENFEALYFSILETVTGGDADDDDDDGEE
jgi:hypothetical protein